MRPVTCERGRGQFDGTRHTYIARGSDGARRLSGQKHGRPRKPICQRRASHRGSEKSLQLLAEGKSSKEVAVALNLSVKTAETHRANIMRRLDCHFGE